MSSTERPRALGLLTLLACCLLSGLAAAYAGSIVNGSSADGTPGYITSTVWSAGTDPALPAGFPADDFGGCVLCHGTNGSAPTAIALNGTVLSTGVTPTTFTVEFGSTTTFTLTFTENPADKNAGGFNVMHNDLSASNANGTLRKVPGDPDTHQCRGVASGAGSTTCNATLNDNTEVMHEKPLARSGSTVTFDFQYVANGTTACTTYEFGLWVNAVNLDSLCFGTALDHAVFRRFRITTNCNDGNGCTNDSCNPGSCSNVNNAAACNDGTFCNGADTCSGGSCSSHAGNPCAGNNTGPNCNDSCNEALNNCTANDNNGTSCSDGLFCNGGDTCSAGACTGHAGNPCPGPDGDGNCSETCNEAANNCTAADPDGSACTDGLFCNGSSDTCSGGTCSNHAAAPCPGNNTGDTCNDSCNEAADLCNANDSAHACDDGNPCTTASACSAGVCAATANALAGTACSDGLFCNGAETCDGSGTCVDNADPCPGNNVGDTCNDSCNEAADLCNANDSAHACNDGNTCTTASACSAGVCAGTANALAGVACSDGLFCNGAETCNGSGTCVDNGDPCPGNNVGDTCNDSCNEAADLCNANDSAHACNDGNTCTTASACSGGVCTGTTNAGPGTACSDGLFCNGAETCDGSGTCVDNVDPCPGNNVGDTCNDSCNEAADLCNANDSAHACNDGNPCTTASTCSGGVCAGTANAGPGTACSDGLFCNGAETCNGSGACIDNADPCPGPDGDGNCAESCDEAADNCTAPDPNNSVCDDGLFCTGTDHCNAAGACAVHSGDPCTGPDGDSNCAESCDDTSDTCTGPDPNLSACNDGNLCNGADTCQAGACTNHAGDPCAGRAGDNDADCSESCNPADGTCTANDPPTSFCNDATFCNGADTCNAAGACANHGGNPCPGEDVGPNCNDSCTEAAGGSCTGADANLTPCSDGNLCNGNDTCNASGSCANHVGDPCIANVGDADNDCSESCNPADGSCTSNDPNLSACNDGNLCNGADTCNGGSCGNHAGDPCAANIGDADSDCSESCNPANGTCTSNDPDLSACNDGTFCNGADTCNGGSCTNHLGDPCAANVGDADNDCSESCNEAADNCTSNDPPGSNCNDSLFCNGNDTCNASGLCSVHVGDPCLANVGDADSDCSESCNEAADNCTANDPNASSCNDGSTCNQGEACQGGVCTGGIGLDCSAFADACHAGICNEPGGCAANPLTGNSCNDGNACTTTDTCQAGTCVGTGALPCDDGNPCTTDTCSNGCVHTNVLDGTGCPSDGNVCTLDTCVAGACHTAVPNGSVPCGAPASCSGAPASAIPAVTCTGGTCPPQAPVSCGANPCNGSNTACAGSCAVDSDCNALPTPPGYFCLATVCTPKKVQGTVCGGPTQCQAGLFCTDSVCCNAACGNGATTDCQACNAAGVCITTLTGTSCSDGLFCNGADTCAAGNCTTHVGNPCPGPDGDANCTESCNEATDSCTQADPNGSACNDGQFCTVSDQCTGGVCGGAARDCSVFTDACNNGICNETSDVCQAQPLTQACNDSDACTTGDQCVSGTCQSSGILNCNDSNVCTNDSCVPASGCAHANVPDDTACTNDGHFCTYDVCKAGQCNRPVAAVDALSCRSASCAGVIPTAQQTSAATCNGTLIDCPPPVTASCGATVPCDGTNTACQGNCTLDSQCPGGFFCNLGTNKCAVQVGTGAGCARTAMCSQAGAALTCVDSVCCTSSCGNGSLTDCQTCNGTSPGTCTPQTGTSCDDGLFCTGADTCTGGACTTHAGSPCPGADGDGNCAESCNEATDSCNAPDPNGSACDDGLFCTMSEKCTAGACGGGTPRDCSASGNQCNTGACNEATDVCFAQPKSGPCNDGSACTNNDQCTAGTCTGTTITCNDSNVCTTDTCNPASGCVFAANTANCDDGNACTTADKCNGAGACAGGPALSCNDNNVCTTDSCVPATGCVNAANTVNCDDSNACTTGDKCANKACVGGAGPNCDDSNPCTDDSCDTVGGCTHTANTASCSDGSACTTNDKCSNKACVPGPALVCDDGKSCTDDSCDPLTGCKATNDDTNTCSDNDACTSLDHCTAGSCVGSTTSCDDSNVCTTDSCDTLLGCKHANNTLACNDSDACTTADKCAGGNCVGGPALNCDDLKPCTADTCDTALGCQNTAGNAGTPCRAANGTCDDPETCTGTSPNCPTDVFNTGRQCSGASCTLGQATPPGVCNGGSGTCPAVSPASCGNYVCSGTVCGTTCTTATDCAQGSFCDATNRCNNKGQDGDPCTSGGQCASTFCADGVCCNSGCSGQCEACNLAASRGTCSPVAGTPVGSRAPCPGTDPTCKGTCNGTDTLACAVPDGSVQCQAPSCNAATNQVTPAAFCNAGSCPASAPTSCGQSICVGTKCSGCQTDVQCGAGNFCDLAAGLCKPLLPPGTGCKRNPECGTGQCVDNVCCNTDCTGQCETCAKAGSLGTCVAVTGAPVGRKPCSGAQGTCAGTCDGTDRGSCVYAGPGTVCTPGSCSGNRATAVAYCDGAGSCPPDTQVDCASGCDGDVCAGGCVCNSGQSCVGGTCVNAKPTGDPCSNGAECGSSYCADGVCCDQACTGQCEACNLAGNEGVCTPATGAPVGSRQPCATDGSTCAGLCDGTNRIGCFYKGASTTCRPADCTNGVATLSSSCQGNGSCGPLQLQDCTPNACDTTTPICANGCTSDATCAGTEFCSGGVCVPKLGPGTPCGASTQCASTHCVDGLCCDTPCTGQCEACDQATKLGTCTGVSGAPRQGRPACAGSGACGGFCSPTNRLSCTVPSGTTACGIAFCQNGYAAPAPACANAVCVTPTPLTCDPFACAAAGDVCGTSCLDNTECARGLVCDNGACVPPAPDAGVDAGSGGASGPDSSVSSGGAGGPDAGVGGSAGTAGTVGMGTGGIAKVDGGVIGNAGQDAGADSALDSGLINGHDTGSCGCRIPGRATNEPGGLGSLALLALLGLRRRRNGDSRTT